MHKKKYNLAQNGSTKPAGETKEDKILQEFKVRIQDLVKNTHDDHYLRKWLKARQFDVDKTEQMFRKSMSFREKLNIDNLLADYTPPEVIQKYLTGGFCGHDKEGSPVRVERYGHLDMKGLMYSCKKLDLEKTKILHCEQTVRDWEELSKKLGRRVDGLTVIFDMEGVSSRMLWRPGLQMYLHLVSLLEDNYPEMMKRMFVINGMYVIIAPRIFPLLWRICRPLISEDMKNKIHVVGGNFKDSLLQHIEADNLPVALGGSLSGPGSDPYCGDIICSGGDVPESYYLQGQTDTDNMTTATVPRGDKLHLQYRVDRVGSVLRWEFKTEDFDINFGVFLLKNDERVPVVPLERVNSHMVPEDGSLTCQETGTCKSWVPFHKTLTINYELCFDNSFSWTRGKKMWYSVEVVAEDDNLQTEIDDLIDGTGGWGNLVITDTTETTRM